MTKEHINALRAMADDMLRVDGDRDHMNPSALTVEKTVHAAKALRLCADELEWHADNAGY